MRRLVTAALSAAIITTIAGSQANAQFVSGTEYYTRYIAVAPYYYHTPFARSIPPLVVGAFYGNKGGQFATENNLYGVIQYVTGIPQQRIPQFSFGNCTINNIFKTCF
jgi:hypothetical protein